MLFYSSCHMTPPGANSVIALSLNSFLCFLWVVMIVSCWISELFPSSRPLLRYGKLLPAVESAPRASIFDWICHPALYLPRYTAFLLYYAFFTLLLVCGLVLTCLPYVLHWVPVVPAITGPLPQPPAPAQAAALAVAAFLLCHALRRLREAVADAALDKRRRTATCAAAAAATAAAPGTADLASPPAPASGRGRTGGSFTGATTTTSASQQHVFVAAAGCVFYLVLAVSPFLPYGLWDWAFDNTVATTPSSAAGTADPASMWAWAQTAALVAAGIGAASAAGQAQARAHATLRVLLKRRVEAAEDTVAARKAAGGPLRECLSSVDAAFSTEGTAAVVTAKETAVTERSVVSSRPNPAQFNSRPTPKKAEAPLVPGYSIPQGGWFFFSSSPHYLAEILVYLALALALPAAPPATRAGGLCIGVDVNRIALGPWLPVWATQAFSGAGDLIGPVLAAVAGSAAANWAVWAWGWACRLPFLLALVWVASNLSILARDTHQWYLKQFHSKYPAQRGALISPRAALTYLLHGDNG